MEREFGVLIGGKWKSSGTLLDVKSPYDGKTVGKVHLAGPALIEEALASSAGAFASLKRLPAWRRSEILTKTAEGIEKREEELARTITLESGKPIRDARGEVRRAATTFRLAAEEARRFGGEVVPLDVSPGSDGRFALVRRFPIGPVLGITPFNFPLNLVAHKVAPAMACCNPIIIKPAPRTPLSALLLGEIVNEAGLPPGGLNVVPCANEHAALLWEDQRIRKLSFTGSAAVGWKLKERAGNRKVTLELGGNAGVIIHGDADLEFAAKRCALGAFSYAGQVCISVQRIYAQKDVFDRFRDLYLEECRKIKQGDPMDEATALGPMIEEAAAIRTEKWVNEAVEEGAKVLLGGGRKGSFMEPTVLTGTKPSMKVCGEEVFAPVVSLEAYGTFEEALKEVNSGLYGLQAGVFTRDMGRVFRAYEELEVGGVVVNDVPTYRADNMPYGGVKMSGFGREGVAYAIEEMTEPKLLALNPSA
ncbi:aldehyde dehydrogenase (NAD+) [uncultured bacterium]|nr:aldehyde dehydrogenase (NAD+) [uncultured bacterium]